MRQDVAARVLTQKNIVPCLSNHCLVATRRLLAGLQRDDVERGAGDGARTRDSLLGKQGVTLSPLVCYELALLARVDDRFEM